MRILDSELSEGGLVIVMADGPEHRYVANKIAETSEVRAILICEAGPRRKWYKVLKRDPLGFVNKALWRGYLKLVRDTQARTDALATVFGTAGEVLPDVPYINVGRAKAGKLRETVASLSPDVLAIYGTSLIPDDVLELPRQVALNMHTGISPEYRGTSCAFWPIHNREPEWVGATVHECTSALDGGQIFAKRHAALLKGDGLHHVFGRAVVAGAQAYGEVVAAAMRGPLTGEHQDLSVGREYRGSARGLVSELKARWNLAKIQNTWSTNDDVI